MPKNLINEYKSQQLITPDKILSESPNTDLSHLKQEQDQTFMDFATIANDELNNQAQALFGKYATIENLQTAEVIKKNYHRLIKLIQNYKAEDNEAFISNFEKEETQRIEAFGGQHNIELSSLLNQLTSNARKYNLAIGTSQVEKEGWDLIKSKRLEIEGSLRDMDIDKVFYGIQDIESLLSQFSLEDIIDEKRAGYFSKGIKNSVMNQFLSKLDQETTLLEQTQGIEGAKDFAQRVNSLFGKYIKNADKKLQLAWDLKQKELKGKSIDIRSVSNNFEALEKNFIEGMSSLPAYTSNIDNFIKKLTNIQNLTPDEDAKIKQAINELSGKKTMIEAMANESVDIKNLVKDKAQILNPFADRADLKEYITTIMKDQSDIAINSALNMRTQIIGRAINASGSRDNIQDIGRNIMSFFSQAIGDEKVNYPKNFSLEKSDNVFQNMQSDLDISSIFGMKPMLSNQTAEALKSMITQPMSEEQYEALRENIRDIEETYKIDLKNFIVQSVGTSKSAKIDDPNFNEFIGDYGMFFDVVGYKEGQNKALLYSKSSPDFHKVVGKLEKYMTLAESGFGEQLIGIANMTGYNVSEIANAFIIDTALKIMEGAYRFGPDYFIDARLSGDNMTVGIETISEDISQKMESFASNFKKMGPNYLLAGDQVIGRGNMEDKKFLGIFEPESANIFDFFRSKAKTIPKVFNTEFGLDLLQPIQNLFPVQQKRVESFFKKLTGADDDIDFSGRLRIKPSNNNFYSVMVDNGYGGMDSLYYNGKEIVINPEVYLNVMQNFESLKSEKKPHAIRDKEFADLVLDIVKISNQVDPSEFKEFFNVSD